MCNARREAREGEEGSRMPRKSTVSSDDPTPIVSFEFQDRTYQIDPNQKKVYRRFVEIETARAVEIFSVWRATRACA
jgi:hypothetical protein